LAKKLLRPGAFIPLLIFFALLLFVGVFALTREGDADISHALRDDPILGFLLDDDEYWELEDLPVWIPPAPPRWFRSNAGGMALEEIPSRLAALRNRHALVIDFISPDELEPFLLPFFDEDFDIEIRVLFEYSEESRRQWLFVDSAGNVRLNAVFRRPVDGDDGFNYIFFPEEDEDAFLEDVFPHEDFTDPDSPVIIAHEPYNYDEDFSYGMIAEADIDLLEMETELETPPPPRVGSAPVGFVEVFNENGRIVRDYLFAEDGVETVTVFFYSGDLLIRAETKRRDPEDIPWEFRNIHTDHFRYNRSFALRYVQRVFHEPEYAEPVRLTFPFRLLDAALQDDFIMRVTPGTDFMETFFDVGDGFNVRYETDARGRMLTQTMFNEQDEVVWEVRNTWEGDRIVAISRTEDGDERLTEFEFDGEGNRLVQREIRNGVLERIVRTYGESEWEELYLDGILVLRALWEDGRKISEERVRR